MIHTFTKRPSPAAYTGHAISMAADLVSAAEPLPVFAEPMTLSRREVLEVLERGNSARLSYRMPDGNGRWRTRRGPYAHADGVMYLPSYSWSVLFESGSALRMDADVSEMAGLSYWRYVCARGDARLLQPTGGAAERMEWYRAMEKLDQAMLLTQSTQTLAFANFGVIRLEVDETSGLLRLLE